MRARTPADLTTPCFQDKSPPIAGAYASKSGFPVGNRTPIIALGVRCTIHYATGKWCPTRESNPHYNVRNVVTYPVSRIGQIGAA